MATETTATQAAGSQAAATYAPPRFRVYGNYSGNYGIHALCFTDPQGRDYYFSYNTLIAFNSRSTGLVCLQNYWATTTGKHLNAIQPDHKKRVDQATFNALFLIASKKG